MSVYSRKLALFFAAVLAISTAAAAQSAMSQALDSYYSYSKQENLNAYYSTIDLVGMPVDLQEARKEATQEIWRKFDTLEYTMTVLKEYEKSGYGTIEYHLAAKIRGPASATDNRMEELSYEDDFIALMHDAGGWKVAQVSRRDVFYDNLEAFFINSQSDTISEINSAALARIAPDQLEGAAASSAAGAEGTQCYSDSECSQGFSCKDAHCQRVMGTETEIDWEVVIIVGFIVGVIAVLAILAFVFKKKIITIIVALIILWLLLRVLL